MKASVMLMCDQNDCYYFNNCIVNYIYDPITYGNEMHPIIEGDISGSSFRFEAVNPSTAEELLDSKLKGINCLSYVMNEQFPPFKEEE